jgi:hypothetical protein
MGIVSTLYCTFIKTFSSASKIKLGFHLAFLLFADSKCFIEDVIQLYYNGVGRKELKIMDVKNTEQRNGIIGLME